MKALPVFYRELIKCECLYWIWFVLLFYFPFVWCFYLSNILVNWSWNFVRRWYMKLHEMQKIRRQKLHSNYNHRLFLFLSSFTPNWSQIWGQLLLLFPLCLYWLHVCLHWDFIQIISFLMGIKFYLPLRHNLDAYETIIKPLLLGMVSSQPREFQLPK